MTQGKIDALQLVLGSEVVLSALRDVFDETLAQSLPEVSIIEDDTVVGQKYRAYNASKRLVENAFFTLVQYKKQTDEKNVGTLHI